MPYVTVGKENSGNIEIYYKDWGSGQPWHTRRNVLGIGADRRKIHFETVDVMRVRNGKITDHWGVANLLSLAQQLGFAPSFVGQR